MAKTDLTATDRAKIKAYGTAYRLAKTLNDKAIEEQEEAQFRRLKGVEKPTDKHLHTIAQVTAKVRAIALYRAEDAALQAVKRRAD